ncbi:hypothetical protein AVEN_98018-1 [Araneus ventricosus]|uniref:Uncharacterized protein n=1 Tax=Araneus ventricosus TaxID=182803 RepID=A0A4Y2G4W1_ARAVE|nr:hypothetical protein AVEN_98018-1 [Araneus ventricosus]
MKLRSPLTIVRRSHLNIAKFIGEKEDISVILERHAAMDRLMDLLKIQESWQDFLHIIPELRLSNHLDLRTTCRSGPTDGPVVDPRFLARFPPHYPRTPFVQPFGLENDMPQWTD